MNKGYRLRFKPLNGRVTAPIIAANQHRLSTNSTVLASIPNRAHPTSAKQICPDANGAGTTTRRCRPTTIPWYDFLHDCKTQKLSLRRVHAPEMLAPASTNHQYRGAYQPAPPQARCYPDWQSVQVFQQLPQPVR